MTPTLEDTLDRARRDRPGALPADFSSALMARIAAEGERFRIGPQLAVALAAAVMLAATAIGRWQSHGGERPTLTVFGTASTSSPFVNP
ncbi:hypothetical protein [Luteolibacter marinus]|uniref:hypothetical protein n=1 Tax=Luteolibacter marinus TaxID=2776705 RepID=UPI0018674961|nr:hypothetical protein [Luteolibacter marinus]